MITQLSGGYQKQIALSFFSLFFISGLASAKAASYHSRYFFAASKNTFTNGDLSRGKGVGETGVLPSVKFQEIADQKQFAMSDDLAKRNAKSVKHQGADNRGKSKPQPLRVVYQNGGPSQPEMSAFKPVGADNMVDLFTGDFSYNIPLLDVGGYPVNIFYNSNISMDQEASWAGLGWNINPGTVTRNMRGLPDDFNGTDKIIKRQSMKADRTWGVSAGGGGKFLGNPFVDLGINAGVSFNNKLGLALDASIHPSLSLHAELSDDKTAALSFGANLSTSSRNGASLTPSISAQLTSKDAASGTSTTGSLGVSYTQTSRSGITGLHLNAGLRKSMSTYEYTSKGDARNTQLSGDIATLSSSLSFAYPTVMPSIRSVYTRSNFNLSFSTGGEFLGLNGYVRLGGFYTESKIALADQETTHPAYGMLYYQKGNADPKALLDFNRLNDGVYTPASPAMALPVYTYDVFNITGEGTGGSFKATRRDVGNMHDAYVKTRDNATDIGLDLGFGNVIHGGAEFTKTLSPMEVSEWKANNLARDAFQFQDKVGNFPAAYFKNPGEKTIPDGAFQTAIEDENLVRLKLSNIRSGTPILQPTFMVYDNQKNLVREKSIQTTPLLQTKGDKRTQVISFLTAEEATRVGFDKNIYSYNYRDPKVIFGASCDQAGITAYDRYTPGQAQPSDKKAHHISEIDVLGSDGKKYIYGLPVYNTRQVDVSFSIDPENSNASTGKSTYVHGTDDTKENTKGRDGFMNQEETPAYTHSYLLTGLVSPNYVDIKGDGITEDDMGDAVKFNYSNTGMYQWRTPFDAQTASYSEALKTDDKDDKAHYIYGQREMWYMYSIESKNMVARFYVSDSRMDGRQVAGQIGGMDPDNGMKRLEKICLYSKGDLMKPGNNPKPIKTIKLFHSYKLCSNTPGNSGTPIDILGATVGASSDANINRNKGKLTLDSIWISYNGNDNKPKNKYVFYYPTDRNHNYSYNGNDRWGNYKPTTASYNPGGLTNADYPYVIQNKTKADNNAAPWAMNKILLPAGGIINIGYESDDYAYVQDRKAASMFSIAGFGTKEAPNVSEQTNSFIYTNKGVVENEYVYVNLTHPITATDLGEQERELRERYFENTSQVFMKLAVKMPPKPGKEGSELISVYADIERFGIIPNTGGTRAYIKVRKVAGESTPMVQQSLQFIKQQLPGKAYPGYDVSENSSVKGVVLALAGMMASVKSLKLGEEKVLMEANKCREVETAKSFVRLTQPDLIKYGGGSRVKSVIISDNWARMVNQWGATYGQEYKYTTTELINGRLNTVSSGVAAWEPTMGGEENPHKEIMRFMNRNKGGPYDFGATEMPLGEAFYPAPQVGYSRVEVLSLHRDTVKNLPSKQVTEFHTTREFPFRSAQTSLTDPEANVKYEPSAIKQLLKLNMKKAITQSQGFLVEMNDMNGKIRMQSTYAASDPVNPVSYTQNFYNVEKSSDKTYKFNHVFPTIGNAGGQINEQTLIGRDIELMADFRQHKSETITTNVHVNLDFFQVFVLPVSITNILQPTVYEGTTYRSASLLKVVNHYGMLDSVVVVDKGSMVSTKNLVYDAETGNPLLTRTSNEHDKPVYNFSYPAHWAYSGMGPAYKNLDITLSNLSFRYGLLQTTGVDMSVFESGDEMYVLSEKNKGPEKFLPCDDAANGYLEKNTENRIWAVNTAKVGSLTPQMVFMDRYGNPYTAVEVSLRIVRSGHRNMLDQSTGTITSLSNPWDKSTNKLKFDDGTNIIQTAAATFKDHWRVDNSFYAKDSTVIQMRYTPIKTVRLYPDASYFLIKYKPSRTNNENFTHYPNPEYFIARRQSGGPTTASSRRGYKSWLRFDLANSTLPLNNSVNILSAKLSLFAHTVDHSHEIPERSGHAKENPHEYEYVSNNRFEINRMIGQWPANNNDQWVNHYSGYEINGITELGTKSPSIQDYALKSDGDRRIDISRLFNEMVRDRVNNVNNATGIKISMVDESNKEQNARVCFFARGPIALKAGRQAFVDVKYYDCSASYPLGYVPQPAEEVFPCGQTIYSTTLCLSKFTGKTINPYVEGILGNWRPDTTYVYDGNRKEQVTSTAVDTRTAGTIVNFKTFWISNVPYLKRNYSAQDVWRYNSVSTQFNRKGYEIENKDPLERFNAGLYGYNQHLPIAVASNARVREVMFDGFEDYDYTTAVNCLACRPSRHANFKEIEGHVDDTQHHTGKKSLRVNGGGSIVLKAPITSEAIANAGYGLRVKIDSTSLQEPIVIPVGTGFRGKYFDIFDEDDCEDAATNANTAFASTSPIIKDNQQIYYPFFGSDFPLPDKRGFAVRWEGYLLPLVSGPYSFEGYTDDGFRLSISTLSDLSVGSLERWGCNWGYDYLNNVNLIKGEIYKIRLDYFENREKEFVTLKWKTPGQTFFDLIPLKQIYHPDRLAAAQASIKPGPFLCTKLDYSQVRGNALTDTFSLIQNRKMLLSVWVKEGGNDCKCSTYQKNNVQISYSGSSQTHTFNPSGSIIEGWQRYDGVFTVPQSATEISLSLKNTGASNVYFDDIRVQPFNANVKSFVYNSSNLRLMAELDENHYSSLYEYDDDGTLTRVKKETVQGIKTVKETRSATQKVIQQDN